MIGIYKITSPSGKIYIGQSVDIEKREKEYLSISNCKGQRKLYNSLLKYGFSEHIFEIIEECKVEVLNERERHWQDFYNVLKEGLNCRLTGTEDKSGKMSKYSIEKMSQSSGKAVLQYTTEGLLVQEWRSIKEAAKIIKAGITNISACCRNKIKSSSGFIWRYKAGITKNTIQVEKVGYQSQIEKLNKPILQYDKSNNFIKEWKSLTEVTNTLGIRQGDISACLTGRQKVAKGFIWKYKILPK